MNDSDEVRTRALIEYILIGLPTGEILWDLRHFATRYYSKDAP